MRRLRSSAARLLGKLKPPARLLSAFAERELSSILLWFGLGTVLAGLLHLVMDHGFQEFLISKYMPDGSDFDNPASYTLYFTTVGLLILGAGVLRIPSLIRRGLRSWWAGVTSGLCFGAFVIGALFVSLQTLRCMDEQLVLALH